MRVWYCLSTIVNRALLYCYLPCRENKRVCVCEWKTLIGIVEYAYMCVSMYGGGGGSGIKWQNYGVCG